MKAFLLDVGVLLTKKDEEYEYYSKVYNRVYGFYDEDQSYYKTKEEAIQEARAYVDSGVNNTYAIVSNTDLPDDFDFEEGCVEYETYKMEDVVYSIAKLNESLVEDFLH